MIPEIFDVNEAYDVVLINKRPYLFSNMRISRDSIPEGMFAYDIGDGDGDGCFARVQKFVMVNHWGTIIGFEEIPLDNSGAYWPEYGTSEYEGDFCGLYTLEEYKEHYNEFVYCEEPDGVIAYTPGHIYYLHGEINDSLSSEMIEKYDECIREECSMRDVEILNLILGENDINICFMVKSTVRSMEVKDAVMVGTDYHVDVDELT